MTEETYYEGNWQKMGLFAMTLILLLTALWVTVPVILALVCFASLITVMAHFNIFESTNDTNKLNKFDFYLQIAFVLISLVKFMVISG